MSAITFATKRQAKVFDSGDARLAQRVVAVAPAGVDDWPAEGLFQPPDDSRLVEVVGRNLHFHPVADGQAHPAFAHLAANGGEHDMLVVQFDAKHRAGQHHRDPAFDFYVLLTHGWHTGNWDEPKNKKAKSSSHRTPA